VDSTSAPAPASAPSDLWKAFYGQVQHPEFPVREGDRVEPMDKIRRLTAEHMVLAKRVAPHVHSFIEIDFTRVDRIRRENKKRWEEQGARVSYTAFVAWACSRVLREFPRVNGTVSGNNLVYRGSVNVGIAVDLDPGLIVPVIRDADDLGLAGIGKRIVDLAQRARDRKLNPDEVQGATFSITNPGVLGTLVGMPVIPKGTSAILGTGAIEKRPVVVEDPDTGNDAIAIRLRSIFSLGYDHRIVDGADAARFLARLRDVLQSFPEDA
jgi:2-oxoglutarate dehydrogenase E2 component (dihydrolipoamide succinyltransferase)